MTAAPWDATELLGLLRDAADKAVAGEPIDWTGPEVTAARILSIHPSVAETLASSADALAAVLQVTFLLGMEQAYRTLAAEGDGDVYEALWQLMAARSGFEPSPAMADIMLRRLSDPGGVRR